MSCLTGAVYGRDKEGSFNKIALCSQSSRILTWIVDVRRARGGRWSRRFVGDFGDNETRARGHRRRGNLIDTSAFAGGWLQARHSLAEEVGHWHR
jgi:hypothetical protein